MKKRILSMALIVAMVVAMIPAVLVNAFAAAYLEKKDLTFLFCCLFLNQSEIPQPCLFFWSLKLVTAFRASGSQRFLPGNSCLLAPKEKGEKWDLRGFSQRERLSALLDDFILLCFKGQSLPFSQSSFHREGNGGWRRGSFHFPASTS